MLRDFPFNRLFTDPQPCKAYRPEPFRPDSGNVSAESGAMREVKITRPQTAEQLDAAKFALLVIAVALLSGAGGLFASIALIAPR